jgi:hypothetical protein
VLAEGAVYPGGESLRASVSERSNRGVHDENTGEAPVEGGDWCEFRYFLVNCHVSQVRLLPVTV